MESNAKQVISACRDMAKAAKAFSYLSAQVVANNSAKGLDWSKSDVIDAQAEGVTPDLISNVLGSLAEYQKFWETHGGNFEKLAPPIV